MRKKIQKINRGYTMVELLFYIALFSIITLATIDSLIIMTKAFREVAIQSDFIKSSAIIERISREIRQANSLNSISASSLKLNTTDELGNNKTVGFSLLDSNLQFLENDVFVGNLNISNVQITSLSFTEITTVTGKAIKISLSIKSTRDSLSRIEDFYDTVVLRGSY